MSLPAIGARVVNVAISRGIDTPDLIQFDDGTVVEVPKGGGGRVKMVRDPMDKMKWDDKAWESWNEGKT